MDRYVIISVFKLLFTFTCSTLTSRSSVMLRIEFEPLGPEIHGNSRTEQNRTEQKFIKDLSIIQAHHLDDELVLCISLE